MLAYECVEIVVILLQTFFIFKFHKSVICRQRGLVRFLYSHLIGSNVYRWCYVVVYEALELFDSGKEHYDVKVNKLHTEVHRVEHHSHLNSSHLNVSHATCGHSHKTTASIVAPYLFPCIVEYSLIAASSFFLMYLNVKSKRLIENEECKRKACRRKYEMSDKLHRIPENHGHVNHAGVSETRVDHTYNGSVELSITDEERNCEDVTMEPQVRSRSSTIRSQTLDHEATMENTVIGRGKCDKAHTGFFLGILIFAALTVNIIMQFIFLDTVSSDLEIETVFHIVYICAYSVLICFIIYLFTVMQRKFKFIHHPETSIRMDQALLYMCVLGDMFFSILLFVSVISAIETGRRKENHWMLLVRQILRALSVYLQAFFVISGMQMRANVKSQIDRKPGRTILTALIFINVILWIDNSLLLRQKSLHPIYISYIGVFSWCLISSIGMPLVIFYRFHSSACLTEIWSTVYKEEEDDE